MPQSTTSSLRTVTACGVALTDGTEIRSRIVVSNADPKRTFLKLVPREHLSPNFVESTTRLKTNAAYLKFHAALNDLPDFTAYFNGDFDPRYLSEIKICPSIEYYEQQLGGRQAWRSIKSACDGGYKSRPSTIQRWHRRDTMSCRSGCFTPPSTSGREHGMSVGRRSVKLLSIRVSTYAPNLRDIIVDWSLFTPIDLERRVGPHGRQHPSPRHRCEPIPSLNVRFGGWAHYRTPITNLYLCGAGTHPRVVR